MMDRYKIRFDRSEAMAYHHDLPCESKTFVADEYVELTYNVLRHEDGAEIAHFDGGSWIFDGEPFSDVVVTAA
jgi:hypothetical protein